MTWAALHAEVVGEFSLFDRAGLHDRDAIVQRIAMIRSAKAREYRRWNAPAERKRRKRRTLRLLVQRLRGRSPIRCANTHCGVEFVPYRSNTRYCTTLCAHRANSRRFQQSKRDRARREREAR